MQVTELQRVAASNLYKYVTNQLTRPLTVAANGSLVVKHNVILPAQYVEQYKTAIEKLFGDGAAATIPFGCFPEVPTKPRIAKVMGVDLYITNNACTQCGAVGLRYADRGMCYFCKHSVRQLTPRS